MKFFKWMIIVTPGIISLCWSCSNESDEPLPVDCSQSNLMLSVDQVQEVSGCGVADGHLLVTGQGGTGGYSFSLNGTDFQSSGEFSGLAAGNYTITVRDEGQCTASSSASVGIENSTLEILELTASAAGCESANGKVLVEAMGDGMLLYRLNEGEFQTVSSFENLAAGIYNITVKDESNCEVSEEVRIVNGTRYQSQVKNILEANCAVSGCHNGDIGANLNWSVFSNVKAKAAQIKTKTQNGQMPPPGSGYSITDDEKALIACWVDDGAQDN